MRSGPRLPQLEKALAQKRRPNTAINLKKKKKASVYLFTGLVTEEGTQGDPRQPSGGRETAVKVPAEPLSRGFLAASGGGG